MKIGITGAKAGLTDLQITTFLSLFAKLAITELHHGDCIGVDVACAALAKLHYPGITIVCHPPVDQKDRGNFEYNNEFREPKTHFARNRQIVLDTELLIACPSQMVHQPFGGTWYTIDYARKIGKKMVIIFPDGHIEETTNGK